MKIALLLLSLFTLSFSKPIDSGASTVTKTDSKTPPKALVTKKHGEGKTNVFDRLTQDRTRPADTRNPKAREIAKQVAKVLTQTYLRALPPSTEQSTLVASVSTVPELKFAADLIAQFPKNPQELKDDESEANILNYYLAQSFLEGYANAHSWPPNINKQALHAYFYASATSDAVEKSDKKELNRILGIAKQDPVLVTIKQEPEFANVILGLNGLAASTAEKFDPNAVAKVIADWQAVQVKHPFKFM